MWSKHLCIFFSHLWQSSVIFRKTQKMLGNICLVLRTLKKSLEIFWKSSKMLSLVCLYNLYNKQNNTWLLVVMEFFFLCSTLYLTSGLVSVGEKVIYLVEHSERNSMSTCAHVLFSIYYINQKIHIKTNLLEKAEQRCVTRRPWAKKNPKLNTRLLLAHPFFIANAVKKNSKMTEIIFLKYQSNLQVQIDL